MAEKNPDDELRALHGFLQQAALHGYPNPERIGCPGTLILREVAAAPAPFKHGAYEHIKRCSPCLAEMLKMRKAGLQEERTKSAMEQDLSATESASAAVYNGRMWSFNRLLRQPWIWIAVCAMLIIIGSILFKVVVFSLHQGSKPAVSSNSNQLAQLKRTINLWDRDTSRGAGEPVPLEAVLLPSALVRVKVILPRMSERGTYAIAVTRDRDGRNVLAHGSAPTVMEGALQTVSVTLDLRKAKAGAYFLQTTQDQNESSYYYPLTVDESYR